MKKYFILGLLASFFIGFLSAFFLNSLIISNYSKKSTGKIWGWKAVSPDKEKVALVVGSRQEAEVIVLDLKEPDKKPINVSDVPALGLAWQPDNSHKKLLLITSGSNHSQQQKLVMIEITDQSCKTLFSVSSRATTSCEVV